MPPLPRVAAVVLCAVALSGCGGDDEGSADEFEGDQQAVASVVDDLGEAARAGDTRRICEDLITVELQRSVRQAAGTSCAQEFQENIVSDKTRFDVESVSVKGANATAAVVDQEERRSTIVFQRVGDAWRIARIQ